MLTTYLKNFLSYELEPIFWQFGKSPSLIRRLSSQTEQIPVLKEMVSITFIDQSTIIDNLLDKSVLQVFTRYSRALSWISHHFYYARSGSNVTQ